MNSVIVLTTHERADWFRAALGDDADFRFDCAKTKPLEDLLVNAKVAGASAVVIDEDHFSTAADMLSGIERYVNDIARTGRPIRIIAVASKREKGDRLLARLAGYCHIYDLLYGVDGVDMVEPLRNMLLSPVGRAGVVELLDNAIEAEHPVADVADDCLGGLEASAPSREEVPIPLDDCSVGGLLQPGRRILLEVIVKQA